MKVIKLSFLFTLTVLLSAAPTAQKKSSYRFSFGPAKEITGYVKVDPTERYAT